MGAVDGVGFSGVSSTSAEGAELSSPSDPLTTSVQVIELGHESEGLDMAGSEAVWLIPLDIVKRD